MKKIQKFFLLMLVVAGLQTQASFLGRFRVAGYKFADVSRRVLTDTKKEATLKAGLIALYLNEPRATCFFMNKVYPRYDLVKRRDGCGLVINQRDYDLECKMNQGDIFFSDEQTKELYEICGIPYTGCKEGEKGWFIDIHGKDNPKFELIYTKGKLDMVRKRFLWWIW